MNTNDTAPAWTTHVDAASLCQTARLARLVGEHIRARDCILLDGALGAGKTAFARALIQSLCDDNDTPVPSPTYTLVQPYDTHAGRLYHYDLYRIEEPDEVFELDWDETRAEAIALVEWPSRLGALTPPDALSIAITRPPQNAHPDARRFTLSASDQRWRDMLTIIGKGIT